MQLKTVITTRNSKRKFNETLMLAPGSVPLLNS